MILHVPTHNRRRRLWTGIEFSMPVHNEEVLLEPRSGLDQHHAKSMKVALARRVSK